VISTSLAAEVLTSSLYHLIVEGRAAFSVATLMF